MSITENISRRQLQLALLFGDWFLLTFSIWLISSLRLYNFPETNSIFELFRDYSYWSIVLIVYFSQYLFDLYEPVDLKGSIGSRLKITLSYFTSAILTFSFLYIFANPTKDLFGRGVFLGSLTLYIFLTYIFRSIILKELRKREQKNRWLLLSSEESARSFINDFHKSPTVGYLEWLDTENPDVTSTQVSQALQQRWTGVIVEGRAAVHHMEALMQGKLKGVSLYSLPDFYELQWGKLPVEALDDSWFAFTEGFSLVHSHLRHRLKRALDIIVSLILLSLLLPVALLTWALVKITSPGRAIYKQTRVGWKGESFTIYKFRSMRMDSEAQGAQWAAVNDNRTTLIGKFIRKFRVDEIPQLINILRGDMSFIGPRPERPEFTCKLAQCIPFYNLRHMVKPGLTGWAQVMYPYGADEEDARRKLEYELYYIKNHSLGLDLKILFKTFSVVLFGAGR